MLNGCRSNATNRPARRAMMDLSSRASHFNLLPIRRPTRVGIVNLRERHLRGKVANVR